MKPWRLRNKERVAILIVGDFIAACIGLTAALYFWAHGAEWLKFSWAFLTTRPPLWFYLLPFFWLILLVETYDTRRASRWRDTMRGIAVAAFISLVIYLFIYFSSDPKSLPRRGVAGFIVAAAVLTLIWRLIYIKIFTAPQFLRRVLIVGAGKAGTNLLQVIHSISPAPFNIFGLIDDDPQKLGDTIEGVKVIGNSDMLLNVIQNEAITDVIFAISGDMRGQTFQALIDSRELGVDVTSMPVIYEELMSRVPIFHLDADWLLRSFLDQTRTDDSYELAKRLLDIVGGLIGLIGLIILFPFVGLAILLDSGSPIFYKQTRLGKGGIPYDIIKFRTMIRDSEKDGKPRYAAYHDARVTRVGNILRKSHIDEVPQFINVLSGQMSLVGPRSERPGFVDQLEKRIPFYRARLLVKPGITGWAQVNYGYAGSFDETATKLEYDLYYIKHRNLLLDLSIMFRTVGTVVGLRGQ
jgi:exopolysaccharide biosynthesis polyprenyl glycosylphosphotransferase